MMPAVAPSATLSNVLTSDAVNADASPVPLAVLPTNLLVGMFSSFAKVTVLSPTRAIGSVPDVISLALSEVRFAPLTAGSVVGNLPFGIVPDPRLSAFNEVNPIPEPLNHVAVQIPVIFTPAWSVVNLSPLP